MFKKVKSLMMAGLLVVGIGFATVDSYADSAVSSAIINSIGGAPGSEEYSINENTIKVVIYNVSNASGHPANTYDVQYSWDASKIKLIGSEVIVTGGNVVALEEIDNENGKGRLIATLSEGITITDVEVGYELVNVDKNDYNPPYIEKESVNDRYKDNMEELNLGTVNNDVRTIGKQAAITQDSWNNFVTKFNAADNFVEIKTTNESNVYEVYNTISGDKIETINITFYDPENKGWLPEITPGTGQALAVGGIVVGTVAVAGLFVNNRRKKDEE